MLTEHVGEEIWEAGKFLYAQLCLVSQQKHKEETAYVHGKRVLELGAGHGIVEMCTAALCVSEVVRTDILPTILDDLAVALKHNAKVIDYLWVCSSSSDNNRVMIEKGYDHCDNYDNCLLSLISKKNE